MRRKLVDPSNLLKINTLSHFAELAYHTTPSKGIDFGTPLANQSGKCLPPLLDSNVCPSQYTLTPGMSSNNHLNNSQYGAKWLRTAYHPVGSMSLCHVKDVSKKLLISATFNVSANSKMSILRTWFTRSINIQLWVLIWDWRLSFRVLLY